MRTFSFTVLIRGVIFIYGMFTTGLMLSRSAIAQVTPDGSLSTTVIQSGNHFTIDNGNRAGNNLFHSFDQFSVPTGGSAIFNNTVDVQNIFGRVTGGSLSNIDGLIQANGTANLFLLNPSGILFGSNASLNIGGSFIGTTASSLQFDDGVEFSAVNASGTPLLTMSAPIGLQMGQNPADIQVNRNGHTLAQFLPRIFPIPTTRDLNNRGLVVNPGNTLSLVGGNLQFKGGILTAESGRIELASVTQGTVGIQSDPQGFRLNYGQSSGLGGIQLAQRSLLDVSGAPSGSVHLQAQNIRLTDGSTIFAQNQGVTSGGILHLNAQDTIEILGFSTTTPTSSIIKAETVGLGQGNDVMVSARHLLLQAGGQITSSSYSSGSTGRMSIQATESIHVLGFAAADPTQTSAFFSQNYGTSLLNSVTVSTQQLKILDGGVITSLVVFGAGEGGILKVSAQSIEVAGSNPLSGIPSLLTTSTFASGNGGDLRIDAATVLVRDGGILTANTVASGNAGDLMINASESITVSSEGSRVGATALLVNPLFQFLLGLPERPSGDAGNVTLTTPQLLVSNQGVVGVRHEGSGNAGHLDLRANTIRLNNQGTLSAATNFGEGGNISIVADNIVMRSGSSITATAGGTGDGGNLVIQSPIILGLENSDIIANATQGNGGNINITTQGIIGLEFRNTLTPRTDLTNDITASSQFSVNGTVQINNLGVDPNAGLVTLPVDLADPSQQIAQGCAANQGSSFVVTGQGGVPHSPSGLMGSDILWIDTRDLTVYSQQPVNPAAPAVVTATPLIQATGWQQNAQGQVELLASTEASTEASTVATMLVATCSAAR